MQPFVSPLAIQASGPRGRTMGSSSRPVAMPSRNSRRFEINESTPEMVRQRPENVSQELPDKHDPLAIPHRLDQLIGSFAAQLRL